MTPNTSELDKIIAQGKVTPETAMIVFAVELKSLTEKVEELRGALGADNERYATKKDYVVVEQRVSRIEKGILWFFGVLLVGLLGVSGSVIVWAIQQQGAK